VPDVIAGQIDVLPSQRRQELQQAVIDVLVMSSQSNDRPIQIDRIPQDDGGRHQIEATGAVTLLLKAAVSDLA
jgi:hypothetical protein